LKELQEYYFNKEERKLLFRSGQCGKTETKEATSYCGKQKIIKSYLIYLIFTAAVV
jgi:hypothetical protein